MSLMLKFRVLGEKMRIFILSILCIMVCFIKSYGEETDKYAYIFIDNALIRNSPEIKQNNIIDKLNTGIKVKIIKKLTNKTKVFGLEANWYKISYSNSKTQEGYIWGGLLSLLDKIIDDDKIIIFGIKEYIKGFGYKGEFKILQNNIVLDSMSFKLLLGSPEYGINSMPERFDFKVVNNPGLNPFSKIIEIGIVQPIDGLIMNIVVIGYSNSKLYYIAEERYRGEGGVGGFSERYFFPNEKNGKPNRIVCIYIEEEFNGKLMKNVLKKTWKKIYKWENNKLMQILK
jgi:hypothetical protein